MTANKIRENIYSVGAIDPERRLFDELVSLPFGTSYNSYLIKGSEKTVLLDSVDPSKTEIFKKNLDGLNIKNIDFVVCHHAEQDHSGSIPKVLEWHPNAKIVTNEKCKNFLKDLLLIPDDKFIVIKDRETISLGDKTLEFILTPWVHWPETMSTYLNEDKILFSCDFLASHCACDEIFVDDEPKVYALAKRYFAEIMMPFRPSIKNNLKILDSLAIDFVCPSHGQIYPKPKFIIDAYKDWVSDNVKNEVLIPYVSMHGSVLEMVEYFSKQLIKRNINVKTFNISQTDAGDLAMALVDAATLVIAAPAVLASAHPLAANTAYLVNVLRPKTKFVSLIGSYGWGAKLSETISGLLANLKAEILEPVIAKGFPKEENFKALDMLADKIAERHKLIGVL